MENKRIAENNTHSHWHKWGPYLSERQWGTVREDYSEHGSAWDYFPHDHARSRVYRWGEDGIAGISDNKQRLCLAVTLWNGQDDILKERMFGLTGPEGNHGEDVKELYYYLDNTPTHSYMKHLYKYPQSKFPYADLVNTNQHRSKDELEYELLNTGIFNNNAYFDVVTEYAKNSEEDILMQITVHNRANAEAPIWVLPTLWCRNLWSFGLMDTKPKILLSQLDKQQPNGVLEILHPELGIYFLYFDITEKVLFTENETNTERLYNVPNASPFVKDFFHTAIVNKDFVIIENKTEGTKAAPLYQYNVAAQSSVVIKLRLSNVEVSNPLGDQFKAIFEKRIAEANTFYQNIYKGNNADEALVQRQAFAGLLWSKQYFNIDIPTWLDGDIGMPKPPESRKHGRNSAWRTLNNEDIISMPDKWEYPWYAAWDLAFHCISLALVDAHFAKSQLILFLREWYMHPNGQIPAYEWAFGDVNPPVHAWACLQVYKTDKKNTGVGDLKFLKRVFQKLTLNFTWWVNRKDVKGNNVFEGGFLGLDNIGVFDRSAGLPGGALLEQADGTSWMAMYCLNMLEMSLLIAEEDDAYEDVATKFFEHFMLIAESLNKIGAGWTGSWDEKEGFFYDVLSMPNGDYIPLKVRSLVGLSTTFAVLKIDRELVKKLPDFYKRLLWFKAYHEKNSNYKVLHDFEESSDILLSLVPKDRMERLLDAMLDENEFLSDSGIRALSKIHKNGYHVNVKGEVYGLTYEPAESHTGLFGGNSNWRGPIWMPMNYMLIYALHIYHSYYKDKILTDFPTGSKNYFNLKDVANQLSKRLIAIFLKDAVGKRPVHGLDPIYEQSEYFKDLILFYEYFDGDTGRGVGATHQTGWTGLVAELIEKVNAE
ncbi:glucosidase [Parasediminibacterium paludis]|uniref:mannosyl-oligosaccharide glucosidase n=1 Tax=Parasediminibacterium paludis TaxID=908966 RepID=A0ABV8PZ85_9BACT